MIQKIPLGDFRKPFPEDVSLFIGMVSFEDRSSSIFENLIGHDVRFLLFKNLGAGTLAQKKLNEMVALGNGKVKVVDLDIDAPTATADAFARSLASENDDMSKGSILLDTTTFTHEQLLILLRVLDQHKLTRRVVMAYTGAKVYSTNTDTKDVWLSRGVGQVRSVLGYPGRFSPSKKLHLVVIVGFEYDRVATVIEQFEPARLTLICGDPEKSVSSEHYEINKHFFKKVQAFVERTQTTQTSVDTCYISCVDPFEARDTVLNLASQDQIYNVVVCPMNTKTSTVGVGMAAIKDDRIQVAYARAIEYNESGYSSPAETATVFDYAA